MTKKALVATIILILLFFGIGMFVGVKVKSKSSNTENQTNTYQAGWDAAKKNCSANASSDNLKTSLLAGKISKIENNNIYLENAFLSSNTETTPGKMENKNSAFFSVTSNTKFYEIITKDQKTYQQEVADFQNKIANDSSWKTATMPQPIERKEIHLSDLATSEFITISLDQSSTDTNLVAHEVTFSPQSNTVQPQISPNQPTSPTTAPVTAPTASTAPTNSATNTTLPKK